MEGVLERYSDVTTLEKGVASVERFEVSPAVAKIENLMAIVNGHSDAMVNPGEYVKLYVGSVLMMSDTSFERITNSKFVNMAHGAVMIGGLGIGLVLNALKEKVDSGVVTKIVVYEKYQDVIDLVADRFKDLPLEVRCEDILTYKPSKGEKYDTIYFDIWPSVCTDNLDDINMLHRRWRSHKNPGGWMSSWMVDTLRSRRRQERREESMWGW